LFDICLKIVRCAVILRETHS